MVILTETIALAAFLYRFTLDRQIIDLHDQIKAKQTIVNALSSEETKYRELQERLQQAKSLSTNAPFIPEFSTRVTNLAQKHNLGIKSFTLTDTNFYIEVTAISPKNLKDFITDLQSQKELSDISIDRIENRTTVAQIAAVISSQVIFPLENVVGTNPTKGENNR